MGRKLLRIRKGHDLESVTHQFLDDDLAELKPKKMFAKKWLILKKLEKRGAAHCYQVCDKACKVFGVLYLEIGEDNVTSIANQVEFSLQQFSQGYSHRFTNVIDSNIINNHVYYMVIRSRPGPTIDQLLNCCYSISNDDDSEKKISSITASFLAIDIISILELLNSSGHVLRNFDPKQWKLDVKTRMFYLDDCTDVTVSSDKRHRSIDEIHIINAESLNLAWTSPDLLYAPHSFILNGPMHRMSEMDQLEMLIYILYDWTRGKLPWTNSKCQQKTMEMKKEFLENLPDLQDKFDDPVDHWFNTALHNLANHLKIAKIAQAKLERQAVRGGAWCPKGPRAGALLSIINYRRIIEDFHKIVCSGRPDWSVHWRDIKLDWDKEVELTPEQLKFLIKYEKRQKSLEIVDEWNRLRATRAHYSVMAEDAEYEKEKNQISIDLYLNGDPNDAEAQMEVDRKIEMLRQKRMKIREVKEEEKEIKQEKKEIKDEIDDGTYGDCPSSSTPAAPKFSKNKRAAPPNLSATSSYSRADRLARRRRIQEEIEIKQEIEVKIEAIEVKMEVKEEEPDDGYEVEIKKKKMDESLIEWQEYKEEKGEWDEENEAEMQSISCTYREEDVKIEEPDDYE